MNLPPSTHLTWHHHLWLHMIQASIQCLGGNKKYPQWHSTAWEPPQPRTKKKTRQQKHKNNSNKHDQTGNLPKKIPILSNSGFKQVASIAARCSAAKVKSTLCRFDLQRFADLAWWTCGANLRYWAVKHRTRVQPLMKCRSFTPVQLEMEKTWIIYIRNLSKPMYDPGWGDVCSCNVRFVYIVL